MGPQDDHISCNLEIIDKLNIRWFQGNENHRKSIARLTV